MSESKVTVNIGKRGLSLGMCLAVVISYAKYKSITWAAIHGILGWIYIVLYCFQYGLN